MSSMSTVQIVAIAVAAAVVVLLIVALLVTRRRGPALGQGQEQDVAAEAASFLDQALQDTFAGLGKAEQSVEDVTLDPVADEIVRPTRADGGPQEVGATEAEITGELPTMETSLQPWQISPPGEKSVDLAVAALAVSPGLPEGMQTVVSSLAFEPDAASALVPLSDIIVTTSNKLVDLRDADVRRMLTDLVKLEIDQAIEYRHQGQTVDAAMQLTEAEKISRALSLHESAQRIREMIEELNRPS